MHLRIHARKVMFSKKKKIVSFYDLNHASFNLHLKR